MSNDQGFTPCHGKLEHPWDSVAVKPQKLLTREKVKGTVGCTCKEGNGFYICTDICFQKPRAEHPLQEAWANTIFLRHSFAWKEIYIHIHTHICVYVLFFPFLFKLQEWFPIFSHLGGNPPCDSGQKGSLLSNPHSFGVFHESCRSQSSAQPDLGQPLPHVLTSPRNAFLFSANR